MFVAVKYDDVVVVEYGTVFADLETGEEILVPDSLFSEFIYDDRYLQVDCCDDSRDTDFSMND